MTSPDLLTVWLSPSFPVGLRFSQPRPRGRAVEAGDVRDESTLAGWLSDLSNMAERGLTRSCSPRAGARRARRMPPRWRRSTNSPSPSRPPPNADWRRCSRDDRFSTPCSPLAPPALDMARDTLDDAVAYPVAVGAAANACMPFPCSARAKLTRSALSPICVGGRAAQRRRPDAGSARDGCARAIPYRPSAFAASASLDDLAPPPFARISRRCATKPNIPVSSGVEHGVYERPPARRHRRPRLDRARPR